MMHDVKWTLSHNIIFYLSPGERKWAELLEAADKVGDSIHHLLDAARTNTDAQ